METAPDDRFGHASAKARRGIQHPKFVVGRVKAVWLTAGCSEWSRRRPLLLDEDELTQRCVSRLDVEDSRRLRLADLTRPHVHLGMDSPVFSTANYHGPNLWSAAIRDAFPDIDGIYFMSRFANEPSVAVFDRARIVPRGKPIPLLEFPLLAEFLDAYGIGIASGGDCWG